MIHFLREMDPPWGNPSSHHSSGKKAKKFLDETTEFLFETFGLKDSHYLFFHSGATEGINTIIRGFFDHALPKKEGLFLYRTTDHPALTSQPFVLERLYATKSVSSWEEALSKDLTSLALANWTWVSNETGRIFPLEEAISLKRKYPFLKIHVDGVQSIPRIFDFQKLSPELDAYTFSGHKFGALKGVGFSFVKKDLQFSPLLYGGGQQHERRSGTENVAGVYSLKLALKEALERFKPNNLQEGKLWFEQELKHHLGPHGLILEENAPYRNLNTTSVLFYPKKSDVLLAAFDIEGLEIGRGSACSLGQSGPNPSLMALGLTADESKKVVRFSFCPFWEKNDFMLCFSRLWPIFQRFI